jgi:hypothetical protein
MVVHKAALVNVVCILDCRRLQLHDGIDAT